MVKIKTPTEVGAQFPLVQGLCLLSLYDGLGPSINLLSLSVIAPDILNITKVKGMSNLLSNALTS